MFKKTSEMVRDFLWVFWAFLCGKVLRMKKYHPRGNVFYPAPGASVRRMLKLIRWWNMRPATMEEASEILKTTPPSGLFYPSEKFVPRVPHLTWTEWNGHGRIDLQ